MKKASSKKSTVEKKASRAPEVWGIVFLFLAAITFLSLCSYNHGDPSFFTQSRRIPTNYIGRLGANVSESLIQLLGLSAFIASGLLLSFSIKLFRGTRPTQIVANIFWHFIAIVTCATFLALVFGAITYGGSRVSSGGWLGAWLSSRLLDYLNVWGATLFTLSTMLIALVFSTPLSASTLLRYAMAIVIATGTGVYGLFAAAARTIRQHRTEKFIESSLKQEEKEREKSKPAQLEIGLETPRNTAKKPTPKEVIEFDAVETSAELASAGLSLLDDAPVEVVAATAIERRKPAKKPARALAPAHNGKFALPSLDFLNEAPAMKSELDRNRLIENSRILETKLTDFGIDGQVTAVRPGPVITMYEFKPGPGVKISQIAALADDLSLALSAQSVRIVAPIPGKSVVGIEIPNDERETVFLRELLSTDEFQSSNNGIPIAIGKDISGAPVVSDIARMPHLLVAGASGKGKSVFINSLICSLLYKFTPNDLRLIMVDPKQVELNLYDDIPHLLLPVVDDMKKASTALKWAVNEMERRYKLLAKTGVRNLAGFNQKLEKDGEDKMREVLCPKDENGMPDPASLSHLFEFDEKGVPRIERLPMILVIIDEFADLMMVAPKDIETSVARLGQKARAAGLHLVIATQRPSVDVITGLIKANLPSRVSFQVASKIDSRTILDGMGAEKLLGNGDMLFIPPGMARLTRIHGAFVTEDEINKICDHWRGQGAPVYKEEILIEPADMTGEEADGAGDELYSQAIAIVRELGQASASMLQRRLKVGYNRAARMIEAMEAQGIVGPPEGAKPRAVFL